MKNFPFFVAVVILVLLVVGIYITISEMGFECLFIDCRKVIP